MLKNEYGLFFTQLLLFVGFFQNIWSTWLPSLKWNRALDGDTCLWAAWSTSVLFQCGLSYMWIWCPTVKHGKVLPTYIITWLVVPIWDSLNCCQIKKCNLFVFPKAKEWPVTYFFADPTSCVYSSYSCWDISEEYGTLCSGMTQTCFFGVVGKYDRKHFFYQGS